ncbi:hypothetical protein GCM10009662_54050 [Catellatospora coxensis]|uniref:DUF397 domain-containing protein n=2 Tax=Catellatospora TaxID=53365 RepID=A0A8J3L934_9ACTN|nr:hypothetical protein Cco03nite_69700 [Catellatospora coxensis]
MHGYPVQKQALMHVQMIVSSARGGASSLWGRRIAMTHIHGGAPELAAIAWRKSVRSGADGNCVEIGRLPGGSGFALRHSRDPLGPVLLYTRAEMNAFLLGVYDGDFDDLLS